VLALLFAGRWWLDRQWYVGPSEGSVALFQGIPLTIVGFELGHPVQVYADLPAAEVRRLQTAGEFDDGIAVADRDEGAELIEQLREDLRRARQAEREAQEDAAGGGP
jgi:hypothetical protein